MSGTGTENESKAVFNLIDEPWLPVRRRSGAVEHIQPWRVTENIAEDPFVAFEWPRPDFNGAAHELLIGLLSTAAAPADDDMWEDWWQEPPAPGVLRECFAPVARAFNLDGPGPRFLQDLDPLSVAKEKEIGALLIDAPGTSTLRKNADLFVKRGGVPVLSRAAAAMALFTLNAFAPSGGAGHRTSLRGGGPMTTLVVVDQPRGNPTLWGRLWPNVESCEQVDSRAVVSNPGRDPEMIFPWIVHTRTSNPKASGHPTTPDDVHPLQVYWGMPRRVRLLFEDAEARTCGLTGIQDTVVVSSYRTRNYGTNYSEGFKHPLTPYYRKKKTAVTWLPVHPNPAGLSYRLWPGLVVSSKDELREPAQVIRIWQQERARSADESRFAAFGYDMKSMKARAWIEGEMPLLRMDAEIHVWLSDFIRRATGGASTVASLVTRSVKSALYDKPGSASGDFGFIADRFYRDTEDEFYTVLGDAVSAIRNDPGSDDPTMEIRKSWAPVMEQAALRLFDEYAPSDGLEDRDMHRHVKARFRLALALRGYGKGGKSVFEGDLGILSPKTSPTRRHEQEAA